MNCLSIKIGGLPHTHTFIYKGREFPFNYQIFNNFSDYFNSRNHEDQPNTKINFLKDYEGSINLDDGLINDFINYCQNQQIQLTNENVTHLNVLSKHYMVPTLFELTKKYISERSSDFVIQFLLMNQNQKEFDANEYEELISEHLTKYVQDEQFLLLSLPSLHRILTKYQLKKSSTDKTYPPEIYEFLFKCLDKFGQKASVLFENIDFGSGKVEYMKRLLSEKYSKIFDFHFINTSYNKTMFDMQNEFLQKEERLKIEQDQIKSENILIKNELEKIKEEKVEQEKKFDNLIQALQMEVKKLSEKLDQQNQRIEILESQKNEISKTTNLETKGIRDELNNQERKFNDKLNELQTNINEISEKLNQQNKEEEQLKIIDESNAQRIHCEYKGDSDLNGIFAYLKDLVILSAGGKKNSRYPLQNLIINDDNNFLNTINFDTHNTKKDGWILFDFGPYRKIDLHSYLIRSSYNYPSSSYHPKTWRIMGSNDNENWKHLDRRLNDDSLNGLAIIHHFECQNIKYGKSVNRYRYIKYMQEDNWCDGKSVQINPYNIHLKFFELYGDIYE